MPTGPTHTFQVRVEATLNGETTNLLSPTITHSTTYTLNRCVPVLTKTAVSPAASIVGDAINIDFKFGSTLTSGCGSLADVIYQITSVVDSIGFVSTALPFTHTFTAGILVVPAGATTVVEVYTVVIEGCIYGVCTSSGVTEPLTIICSASTTAIALAATAPMPAMILSELYDPAANIFDDVSDLFNPTPSCGAMVFTLVVKKGGTTVTGTANPFMLNAAGMLGIINVTDRAIHPGTYDINIEAHNGNGVALETYTFTYDILDPCTIATVDLVGTPYPLADVTLKVLDGAPYTETIDLSTATVTDSVSVATGVPNACGAILVDLVSTQFPTASASPPAATMSSTTMVTVSAANASQVGISSLQIGYKLDEYPSITSVLINLIDTFTIEPCEPVLGVSSSAALTYFVGDPTPLSYSFSATQTPNCGYPVTASSTFTSASFTGNTMQYSTTNPADANLYQFLLDVQVQRPGYNIVTAAP